MRKPGWELVKRKRVGMGGEHQTIVYLIHNKKAWCFRAVLMSGKVLLVFRIP